MKDGCKGKVRHRSQSSAVAAMKRIGNAGLSSYRCRICGNWHIGNSRSTGKIMARLDQLFAKIAAERRV